jgi:hypothetical protein
MPERVTNEDLELLDELGVDTQPQAASGRTAKEQRIIAGFEEIERFVEQHGRIPEHGESRDIFERLYAVRLDRLRESEECRAVLKGMDSRGLLSQATETRSTGIPESDEALLAALGVDAAAGSDISELVHVRSRAEINAAEEVARRTTCEDFERFRPIFETVQRELADGVRTTVKYGKDSAINEGDLFIIDGQKALVAEVLERFESFGPNGRLRVIFDNGTESNLLIRSLQRALYKDEAGRRIIDAGAGPLFSDSQEEGDLATGYVYVLRSKSDHPFVAKHRDVLHKIGVTGSDVRIRTANARKDPTYLLADAEVVAEYRLANVDRQALEAILHRIFGAVRLDMQLKDRFGSHVEPREWFLVPLPAIDEAIQRIKDGTIGEFRYDPMKACLVRT